MLALGSAVLDIELPPNSIFGNWRRHKKSRGVSPSLAVVREFVWLRRLPGASPLGLPCIVAYLLLRGSWGIFLSKVHPFLQVRVGDVEHLHVGVHRLLHHLLQRLLLLLGLLLEGLLLLVGLLHPLLGELLEGLLLLLGLPGGVGAGGAEELHVGVHELLDHLLGVVLLLLDLLGELLHLAKPFPSPFRCLHSPVCVLAHRLLHTRLFLYIVVRTRFRLRGIRWRFVNRYGGATSLHPPLFWSPPIPSSEIFSTTSTRSLTSPYPIVLRP